MVAKLYRRLSAKTFAFGVFVLTVLLYVYYTHNTYNVDENVNSSEVKDDVLEEIGNAEEMVNVETAKQQIPPNRSREGRKQLEVCPRLTPAEADISTVEVFRRFDFQVRKCPHLISVPHEGAVERRTGLCVTCNLQTFNWLLQFHFYLRLSKDIFVSTAYRPLLASSILNLLLTSHQHSPSQSCARLYLNMWLFILTLFH